MYVKIIDTDLFARIVGYSNFGNYPYNLPKKDNGSNVSKALNTLEYNNENFNPNPVCAKGGLYFCKIKDVFFYIRHGNTLCIVEPTKDAQVIEINKSYDNLIKYKTDKLYITQIMELWNVDTIRYLVENGANIYSSILFNHVCKFHHLNIVKYLCEYIHNTKKVIVYWNIVCENAIDYGDLEIIKYLINSGWFCTDDRHWMVRRAAENNVCNIVEYLTKHFINKYPLLFKSNSAMLSDTEYDLISSYRSALANAATYGCLDVVKYLMESTDLTFVYNIQDIHWALCTAIQYEQLDVMQYLIEKGAYHSTKEYLALEKAFRNVYIANLNSNPNKIVFNLIDHIITKTKDNQDNQNDYDDDMLAIMRLATTYDHLHIIHYLENQGVDINSEREYILNYAVECGSLKILKYLCELSPINDSDFISEMLDIATENNYIDIICYLNQKYFKN